MGIAELPSVKELNRNWGSAWREVKERQYYSTHLIIIEEVKRRVGVIGDCSRVVKEMEEGRMAIKASLDKVYKALKAVRDDK